MSSRDAGAKHRVSLTTRDGQQVGFDCAEGESLLDAAARAGLHLPAQCRSGSCGACRGRCTSGEIELGEHTEQALSAADQARGETLLCSSFPRSDVAISVEQDLAVIQAPGPVERSGEVVVVEPMGGGVMRLLLKLGPAPDGSTGADFIPGQFCELTLPDGAATRAYSIANTPNWDGLLEFWVRLQPNGKFSTWLQGAQAGEQLKVKGPSGGFTLDESSYAPRWFVAGGTGLAPIAAMLRWMGEMSAMQPARLWFGLNREADLFAQAELEALQGGLFAGLEVNVCLWQPSTAWSGCRGTPLAGLRPALAQALVDANPPTLYVCGPAALVEAVVALAAELGLDPGQVVSERFLPG